MYNVSMPILIRAEEVSNLLARFEIDQLFNEGLDADEVRELAESEKIVRSFIALNLDEMVGEEFEEMLETLQNIVQVWAIQVSLQYNLVLKSLKFV